MSEHSPYEPPERLEMMHPLARIRAVHDYLIPKNMQRLIGLIEPRPGSEGDAILNRWESAQRLAKLLREGMGEEELIERIEQGEDLAEAVLLHHALTDLTMHVESTESAMKVPVDAAGVAMVALQCWLAAMIALAGDDSVEGDEP